MAYLSYRVTTKDIDDKLSKLQVTRVDVKSMAIRTRRVTRKL
jgi:hypothetical protein